LLKTNKSKINPEKAVYQSPKKAKVLKGQENKMINKKDKNLNEEVGVKQSLKEEGRLKNSQNLLKKKLKIRKTKTKLINLQSQEKEEDQSQ